MPTMDDALEFVSDPETSREKLMNACSILGLSDAGDSEALRSRLLAHLDRLPAEEEVVCLNPNLPTGTGM